ncbi:MAG: YlbF family regulator [Oscillospiraceae bacterium]|jgi:cell fate (sporulation/competence/biofilm development) regulator YlbF (YheA/YmcA/DUF963 family)|nr:YlbF family regulator [Oscillospiraceae bacterium]
MDIIQMTRDLCKEIQKDDRYLKMQLAVQNTDGDKHLQDMIGQYNLKRMSMESEVRKQDRDQEKLQAYQQELNGLYETIMKIPSMIAYNEAKTQMDLLLRRVNAIIEQSANGADPETADYTEHSCGGECGSCSGCH